MRLPFEMASFLVLQVSTRSFSKPALNLFCPTRKICAKAMTRLPSKKILHAKEISTQMQPQRKQTMHELTATSSSERPLRRSARLREITIRSESTKVDNEDFPKVGAVKDEAGKKSGKRKALVPDSIKRGKGRPTQRKQLESSPETSKKSQHTFLPRTRELQLKEEFRTKGSDSSSASKQGELVVFGVDEAGRGPLCGPVVAAAAYVPMDIEGIVDSKKIINEQDREALYERIVSSDHRGVRWAVAVVDAKRIDEINILQATMEAMSLASEALVALTAEAGPKRTNKKVKTVKKASASEKGCYVVCGSSAHESTISVSPTKKKDTKAVPSDTAETFFALIDGNRCPESLPCESNAVVKGDSKEYCIAAASILAKVTRDRLMHEYDALFPQYNLKQHKGYPTKAHVEAIMVHGASPHHRLTFKPLKEMSFDHEGKIISVQS